MSKSKVTLYTYATSPYGIKVYWALIFKRIEFEIVYVNPFHQKEIEFTQQRVVPVLQVGSEWRLDSTPICLWLEELFPSQSYIGVNDLERDEIKKADDWVTRNLIGSTFRSLVDPDVRLEAFSIGRNLVKILRKTSKGVPWFMQFFWSTLLKRVPFIKKDAAMTDLSKPFSQIKSEIIDHLNQTLKSSDFLAGTDQPSYADISAFAQINFATLLDADILITSASSTEINAWYKRMEAIMPEKIEPILIPEVV